MLFSVLIVNYYSASIVSDRLKNVAVKMNDSLISLADSNLKVAAEPTPYVRSFLQVNAFTCCTLSNDVFDKEKATMIMIKNYILLYISCSIFLKDTGKGDTIL